MRIVLRAILLVVLACAAGVLGMAIFSDLPPPQTEVSLPIEAM